MNGTGLLATYGPLAVSVLLNAAALLLVVLMLRRVQPAQMERRADDLAQYLRGIDQSMHEIQVTLENIEHLYGSVVFSQGIEHRSRPRPWKPPTEED